MLEYNYLQISNIPIRSGDYLCIESKMQITKNY